MRLLRARQRLGKLLKVNDEQYISRLHKKIIDLQRELLENYRDLQVELRNIVGDKCFSHLKSRIDLILKGKKKVQVGPATSSAGGSTGKRKSSSENPQAP
ncbi:MAG TPA: hypothetical protein QF564_25145 [Pirellulaceae bacterium]|jgi:hypothetical protein|nr:hypothetical protein [Pirellulaceae bacterium]